MRHAAHPRGTARRALATVLSVLLIIGSGPLSARGPSRAGVGDLDDFDPTQPSIGLPANLNPGLEPAGTIGDTRMSGIGGVPNVSDGTAVLNQAGDQVELVSGKGLNGKTIVVGVARRFGPDGLPPLLSLKQQGLPVTPGMERFVRNRAAAIALGKALFWDAQVGSDGNACASCHFHAGADNRTKNQLSPGFLGGDITFKAMPTGSGGPNYQLKPGDFPTHRLADPLDRNSEVLFDSNDVVASQGTFGASFLGLATGVSPQFKHLVKRSGEKCGPPPRDEFNVGNVATRRVEPRNTPTVINAVFNHRNFWDGRANNIFNGVNPFGPRDTGARVLEAQLDGSARPVQIALPNASLASQAVGPALSSFEMSCASKAFHDLGRKMLSATPLKGQEVHATDSVLAAYRHRNGKGLTVSYPELVRAAFEPRWWQAPGLFDGYTQMEANFSLYWGIAIMLYESTLVSDQAPIDRFVGWSGTRGDINALTPPELHGLAIFRGKAMCISCHKGAEFTAAASNIRPVDGEGTVLESMFLGDGTLAVYDNGFYNIGVRPAAEDRGVGGSDPFGNPLSFSRMWFTVLEGGSVDDPQHINACLFSIFFDPLTCWTAPDPGNTRVGVDGAFKTPTLRNVALTQPYFHNGSRWTLEQVVEFYNRGGDRRGLDGDDSTGYMGPNAPNGGPSNIHPDIHPLNLSPVEKADLVAFVRHGLTDPRVACERAPFDHPALKITNGHVGNPNKVRDLNRDDKADDEFIHLPAVGAAGLPASSCLVNDDGTPVRP